MILAADILIGLPGYRITFVFISDEEVKSLIVTTYGILEILYEAEGCLYRGVN